MNAPILDETDTALVRFFRTRRRLFHGLIITSLALAAAAFILIPVIRQL